MCEQNCKLGCYHDTNVFSFKKKSSWNLALIKLMYKLLP